MHAYMDQNEIIYSPNSHKHRAINFYYKSTAMLWIKNLAHTYECPLYELFEYS